MQKQMAKHVILLANVIGLRPSQGAEDKMLDKNQEEAKGRPGAGGAASLEPPVWDSTIYKHNLQSQKPGYGLLGGVFGSLEERKESRCCAAFKAPNNTCVDTLGAVFRNTITLVVVSFKCCLKTQSRLSHNTDI